MKMEVTKNVKLKIKVCHYTMFGKYNIYNQRQKKD